MGEDRITAGAARFIEEMDYGKIPPETIGKARYFVMDFLGVTAGGSAEPAARIVRESAPAAGGCSIIGSEAKTTPEWAALANGTAGHALDFDDVSEPMYGHPSVAVLPAAIAIAEALGLGGRELLLAYIVGLEFAVKLSHALNPGHYRHGWHSTASLGSVGAAAAAAKLYGLAGAKVRSALAMGCTQAFGLQKNFGTMTKPLHAGRAAQNGVMAGMLAAKGFTGDQSIFDAPAGFFQIFGEKDECRPEEFVRRLGEPLVIEDSGLIIKKHPSCAFTHPAVDAALEIAAAPGFDVDKIEKIEGEILPMNDQVLLHKRPATGLEAKFSLEGCLAMAFIDGKLTSASFSDESVLRPEVRELIAKVERKVEENKSGRPQDFGPSSVRVFMRGGKVLEATVKDARGTPKNPMSPEEIEGKYRDCCSGIIVAEKIEKSLELIRGLDKLPTLGELMECYRG